ncbi:MAG: hypothetical protein OXR73_24795 [Myxococcales bacterium]|nr:hypothetical protein [Myxococcales bacterium]
MNESALELETWHLITMFATVGAGIFRSDIKQILNAYEAVRTLRPWIGKRVYIREASGAWEEVTIQHYTVPIPFLRAGGVTVVHEDPPALETFGFDRWAHQRIRKPKASPDHSQPLGGRE